MIRAGYSLSGQNPHGFAKHDVSPAWLAWDAFDVRNGAASFTEMRDRIERLRHDRGRARASGGDYAIGCVMLAEPVFLPREAWVRPPEAWPENVVQGKVGITADHRFVVSK